MTWRMQLLVTRYKSLIIIVLLFFLAGFFLFRWWQGRLLPSYEVVSSPLIQTVVASGRVEKVSRTQIGSEITGVVLERLVQEGDRVSRGDVLLILKSDEISAQVRQAEAELKELATTRRPQAEVDLANAKVQLEQAQREAVRRRNTELGILSAEEREKSIEAERLARNNLESARLKVASLAPDKVEEIKLRERLAVLQAQLSRTKIRAEVSGIILTRNVEPGDLVQPSQTLFTIALDGATEIRVPFDERNLPLLALQQKAAVIADAYPDQPFPAHINFIAPSIDAQRGTVDVRLTVDPVPDFLRQDMTISVNVETNKRERTLVIPNDALSSISGNKAMVILVRDRKIQRHPITLGLRGLVMSEVVAGLKEGDHVLTDAESVLKDGTRVRIEQTKRVLQSQMDQTNSKNELPVKFD